MDKVIVEKELGEVGDLKVEVVAGKILVSVSAAKPGAQADLKVNLDPDHFLDKLAAAIPGQIDDAVINMLKAALKA